MKLYHSPNSPYVRTVMIVLHETGAVDQVDLIPASGTALDPGTAPVDANPLGKVPTLVLSDGQALYDSRTICRYLAGRYQPGLYPDDARALPVQVLEAAANGIMDAAYLMVMESRLRPADKRFAPWVEGQWTKIARALDSFETRVGEAVFDGPTNIGQLALGAALGYVDFRLGDRNWRDGRPRLAAWEARIAERPALQATLPPQ